MTKSRAFDVAVPDGCSGLDAVQFLAVALCGNVVTNQRKDLMMLRKLYGLHGELGAGLDELRDDALCYNCDGQGSVFPGLPGRPQLVDTSRIVTCPICDGTGRKPPQMRLID